MNYALILAAGKSSRFNGNKIFATLWGRPILEHVLILCETSKHIDSVHIAYKPKEKKRVEMLCKKNLTKPFTLVAGGKTRLRSSIKLIKHLSKKTFFNREDFFVVLNGANPLSADDEIERCLKACTNDIVGAGVGRPVTSSLKKVNKKLDAGVYEIEYGVDRIDVCEMETPQAVKAQEYSGLIDDVLQLDDSGGLFTDELSVFSFFDKRTAVVTANYYNRKITTIADRDMMNGLITAIGIGEDSHELIKSEKALVLGGVEIPSEFAFAADSDGDVVLHAITNAISSAMGGNSLGTFATAMCEDGITNSREYLKVAFKKQRKVFLGVACLSLSFEGSYPKIDQNAAQMRESLSALLDMPVERIGITATTGKSHSAYGEGRALKVSAVILLRYA